MSALRHPTAIIHPNAKLADDVSVGPYTIIGEHVEIGAGTTVGPHVVIDGHTTIGRNNRIFQFSSLGEVPQDKKFKEGDATRLVIGDNNTIREFCTFNLGTVQDRGVTSIGNNNWIMAYVHLAHDCEVGNNTIFANNASLAGHVIIEDYAILGGFTTVHQFVRVGAHVITALSSTVYLDIPTYVTASGNPAAPHGINSEGLKRRGFSSEAIMAIKRAYKTLYRSGMSMEDAKAALISQAGEHPEVMAMAEFLGVSQRGIIR